MDKDELKATFHRVAAYRHVCRAVRASANHTFVSAVFFAVIAGLYSQFLGFSHPLFLFIAGLALLEFAVGFWKKLAPSVECVFVDAFTNFAFGASVLARQGLAWQNGGAIQPFSVFIGAWALFDAWRNFQSYLALRRAFEVRPTRTQMNYVAEMIRDIRDANPEDDPTALDLPRVPVKAQLAEDFAFLIDPHSGEALVLDREDLVLTREADGTGRLILEGHAFPSFPLDEANWRNYLRWKGNPEVA